MNEVKLVSSWYLPPIRDGVSDWTEQQASQQWECSVDSGKEICEIC